MRINNNLMAMNTHRQLGINSNNGAKSIEKLSSGYRINRAGDDAAGLAISEKMRGQIRGLNQASRNAQDSISLVQTAEGALNESQAILQRMRELAVQSANDTNVDTDRDALQNEVDQLATELTRITNNTEFNERTLLNGALDSDVANAPGEITFHIGANESQNMTLEIAALDAQSLGVAENVESVAASLTADANFLGANTSSGATIEEGVYTLTIDAVNGTAATLTDADGTTVATATNTHATDEVLAFAFTDGSGTLNVSISSAAATNTTVDITVGANGINLIGSTDIEAAQLTTGTLEEGSYSLRVYDENASGAAMRADLIDVAGNVISSDTTMAAVAAAEGSVNQTLEFNVDGQAIEIDVALNATSFVSGADTTATFEVIDSNYVSGTSDAATFAGGQLNEEADVMKGVDIRTQSNADAAITTINDALKTVSDERAKLGAVQNRLEHTIKNVDTSSENLQASESRIRDVDMAKEMMEFTKNNILSQAAQSMLAQANQAPQGVLSLLR
jgi:flagellin